MVVPKDFASLQYIAISNNQAGLLGKYWEVPFPGPIRPKAGATLQIAIEEVRA